MEKTLLQEDHWIILVCLQIALSTHFSLHNVLLIGFILAVEDILDEYLVPERIAAPHEETIAEEECSSTIVLERSAFHLLFKAAVSLCVCLCVSVCTPHFFLTRSSDHDYIWHAYADRSGNGSILKI